MSGEEYDGHADRRGEDCQDDPVGRPIIAVEGDTLIPVHKKSFVDVMKSCQQKQRPGQDGTWITDEMIEGYSKLYQMGFAHSVEAFDDGALVGGLYGVSIGTIISCE